MNRGWSTVNFDPRLRWIARGRRLIAHARRRACNQADSERPFTAEVDLERRNLVRVFTAADPGSAAVLGDPELHGSRPVGPCVLDSVLEPEPGTLREN